MRNRRLTVEVAWIHDFFHVINTSIPAFRPLFGSAAVSLRVLDASPAHGSVDLAKFRLTNRRAGLIDVEDLITVRTHIIQRVIRPYMFTNLRRPIWVNLGQLYIAGNSFSVASIIDETARINILRNSSGAAIDIIAVRLRN